MQDEKLQQFLERLRKVDSEEQTVQAHKHRDVTAKTQGNNGFKANEGIYVYEEKGRRTKNARCYKNSKGQWETLISGAPVHYYNSAENRLRQIDNTLEHRNDLIGEKDFVGYENKYNSFKVRFVENAATSDLMRVEKNGYEIYFRLLTQNRLVGTDRFHNEFSKNIPATLISKEGSDLFTSGIKYCELYDNVDFDYEVRSDLIKENITIKTRRNNYNFAFKIHTKGLRLELSGKEIVFIATESCGDKKEGEVIFTMPAAYMYDKNNKTSKDVLYIIESAGEREYILKVLPDACWINSAERIFPVVIDPSILINDDNDMIYRLVCNYAQHSPESDFYRDQLGFLPLGYFKGNASAADAASLFGETELYIGFKNSDRLFNGLVNAATLYIPMPARLNDWGVPDVLNTNGYYEVYGITANSDWMDQPTNWNNRPATDGKLLAFAKPVEGENGNFGLILDITTAFHSRYTGFFIKASTKNIVFNGGWQNSVYIPNEGSKALVQLRVSYTEPEHIRGGKVVQQSCNQAGNGAIDLFTGYFTFVHEDLQLDGVQFPVNVSHVYQSKFFNVDDDTDYKSGMGWRLNFMQTLKQKNKPIGAFVGDEDFKCYEYTDASGNRQEITTRYYELVTSDDGLRTFKIYSPYDLINNSSEEVDSEISNDNYTLTEENSEYILTDQFGNKMRFSTSTGRLLSVEKPETATKSNYKMSINYGSSSVSLTDANGRTVLFQYSNNKLLRICYNNEVVRSYTYQTINSLDCLKTIVSPSGTTVFDYDNKGCLCKVTDPTGYIVEYKTYYDQKPICDGYRIKCKNQEIAYNEDEYAGAVERAAERIADDVNIVYNSEFDFEGGERFNGFYSSNPISNMTRVENLVGAKQYYIFHPNGSLMATFDEKFNQEVNCITIKNEWLDTENHWKKVELTQSSASVLNTVNPIKSGSDSRNLFGNSSHLQKDEHFLASCSNLETGCYVFTALITGNIVSGQTFDTLENTEYISYVILKAIRHLKTGKTDVQFARLHPSFFSNSNEQLVCLPFIFDETVSSVDLYVEVNKNPEYICVTYWDVTRAAKATVTVVNDKDRAKMTSYSGKYVTELRSDLSKRSDGTKQTTLRRKNSIFTVTSTEQYDSDNPERVKSQSDGISLNREYEYDDYGNIKSEEVCDTTSLKKMIKIYSYDHTDSRLTHNVLCGEEDESGNKTLYDYEPQTGFIKRTTLPGTNQNIDYAYNGIEGLLKEIKAVENSGNCIESTSNTFHYNMGYLTRLSHHGCDYNLTYDGFGRIIEIAVSGRTIIQSAYTDNGTDIDGVEGATSKSAVAYYNQRKYNGALCGTVLCGQTLVAPDTEDTEVKVNSASFCGALYCGDAYCSQGYAGAHNLGKNDVYVSYYDKNGDLIKVRHAVDRELDDHFDADNDYVTIAETMSAQKRTVAYTIGSAKYEYNYDRETGELLDITEYDGTSPKIKFSNTEYDSFGRNKEIKFTIDNTEELVYNYTYKSDYEDTLKEIQLPNGKKSTASTDGFGRLTERSLDTPSAFSSQYTYKENDAYTTPLVESETLLAGSASVTYRYTYDANNNITQIRDEANVLLVSYEYDGLNRLIRENIVGGNTTVFKYDQGGNPVFKKVYAYSEAAGNTVSTLLNSSSGTIVEYGYNARNRDLLVSYNGSGTLEYDNYGNPKKWFKHGTDSSSLEYTLQWEHVSNLTEITDEASGTTYFYKYNDQGIRTEKVVNGVTHKYYLHGEQIIAERYEENLLKFYYDTSGVCGFHYNGTDYYYRKNIQGDIIAIYDGSGNCYATYGYDAWGKFTIFTNVDDIANINPFKYRGYYFDSESNLYYLNSRYYDPEIGRFISPDSTEYLDPKSVNGLNLYAYCGNNPVMNVDPEGNSFLAVILILAVTTIIGGAIAAKLAADEGKKGWGFVKDVILGATIGLAVGGAILAIAGVAVGAIAGASYIFLGLKAYQVFAIGALAFNFTAFIVAPLYGFEMEGIDFEIPKSPYDPPKKIPLPPHPYNKRKRRPRR